MGPFGSGKSSGALMEIVRRAHNQVPAANKIRRTRWAVVRNSYIQLRDTTVRTVHDWFPPSLCGEWRAADHEYLITCFPGVVIELLFRALDRPDQVSNLLSLELTGAWFNEAREIPWTIVDAMDGRIGRYPPQRDEGCTWCGMILDTNPPDTDSRWYKYFEEDKPANAALFKQPSGRSEQAENLPNIAPGYYTNLSVGKSADFLRVYVDGEYGYVQDGKPVYPEYRDNLHCGPTEYNKKLPIRRGWDFGLTPACTFSQLHANGRWVVLDELCADDMGITRFGDAVLRHSAQFEGATFLDAGDPAGEQRAQTDERTCFEILAAKGMKLRPGPQSVVLRLESVRKQLSGLIDGEPAFLVDPRCKLLRKGFQGKYRYRRLHIAADRYTDEPEKNEYSHPHDALQYSIASGMGASLVRQTDGPKLPPIHYPKVKLV